MIYEKKSTATMLENRGKNNDKKKLELVKE